MKTKATLYTNQLTNKSLVWHQRTVKT